MKHLFPIALVLSLLTFSGLNAQSCLPGGITFTTQSQVDSFQIMYPSCDMVEGSITIQGSDITDLSALSVITGIGGSLAIENNPVLTSLNGLENIHYVEGGLYIGIIEGNPALENIQGLSGIEALGTHLTIINNVVLNSLSGLQGILVINGLLKVQRNDSLPNLLGLDNIRYVDHSVEIEGNNSLLNLIGLGSLDSIGNTLTIKDNTNLSNLMGLNNLKSVSESLSVGYNDALVVLRGLNSLQFIGETLWIRNNPSLVSIINLESLSKVGFGIDIHNNISLTSLHGLEKIISIDLFWAQNNSLLNLEGLENLNSATLFSFCEDSIVNLAELTNLTDLGSLTVCGYSFESFTGLEHIDTLGLLFVTQTQNLHTISGLENLVCIKGSITFSECDGMNDLSGLENLNTTGQLNIHDCSFTSLNGLNNLTYIGAGIYIKDNEYLSDITALMNLDSIDGEFKIFYNESLTNLSGLDNIDPQSIINIRISNNPNLSTCHVQSVCDFILDPVGSLVIHDNLTGCNNVEEIEEGCGFIGISEADLSMSVSTYPNPFTTNTTIEYELIGISDMQFTIYNIQGVVVYETEDRLVMPGSHKVIWSPSHLPKGLYYAVLRSEEGVGVVKMIKQ